MTRSPADLRRLLGQRPRQSMRLDGFAEAAVLVPIIAEPARHDRLLFTVRHAALSNHAGQISFPGGKRDGSDADLAATAVRETAEELGVAPSAIEIVGMLDDVPTPTGFVITPVVGWLHGPLTLTPNPSEVAEVFSCELAALASGEGYSQGGVRRFRGVEYVMHEYLWGPHRIWGATARMVYQLLEVLR